MGLGNGSATADRFAAYEKSAPPSGYRPRGASDPATDTPFLGAFLDHLEKERDNSARSRNVRLAALHLFFRFVACMRPSTTRWRSVCSPCKVKGTYVGQSAFSRPSKSRLARCAGPQHLERKT
jgi:hypothetical protein